MPSSDYFLYFCGDKFAYAKVEKENETRN